MWKVSCCALLVIAVALASSAGAQDTCSARGSMADQSFAMAHCAVALYDEKGVTLWVSEDAIPPEEVAAFHTSSYPKDTDPDGKPRTMMSFSFCPGGDTTTPSPAAVLSVEMALNHASSPMLSRNWVIEPAKGRELMVEALSGDLKPGGKLAGRIRGTRTDTEKKTYSWEVDFDLTLPETPAAAGPSCGG